MFSCVSFGDARAIELRGNCLEKSALIYLFACALNRNQSDIPCVPSSETLANEFFEACNKLIDTCVNVQLRWLMLCTSVDFLTEKASTRLQTLSNDWLGATATTTTTRCDVVTNAGLAVCNRVWFFDRHTRRFFCCIFDLEQTIYKPPGTLLAGVMLRHQVFVASTPSSLLPAAPATPPSESRSIRAAQLHRLQSLLSGGANGANPITESQSKWVTDFVVQDVKMWCGDGDNCIQGSWLFQQLNVWFNTIEEPVWFRRCKQRDVCAFRIDITPSTITHFTPIHAPSALNTILRYPRGNVTVQPQPLLFNGVANPQRIGIGHFLPLYDENGNDWQSTHIMMDVRLFRMYKTQYPFIYTLMPDNDDQVRELKTKLKTSAELNPLIGTTSGTTTTTTTTTVKSNNTSTTFVPLVVTLPTLECDRYVRGIFKATPKYQYRLFYCARFDASTNGNVTSRWVPVLVKD